MAAALKLILVKQNLSLAAFDTAKKSYCNWSLIVDVEAKAMALGSLEHEVVPEKVQTLYNNSTSCLSSGLACNNFWLNLFIFINLALAQLLNTRGAHFECSYWQIYLPKTGEETKTKKKCPGMAHLKSIVEIVVVIEVKIRNI